MSSTGNLGTHKLSDGVRDVDFEILAHVEDADYEWSAEAILRRVEDGQLFYVSDSGCSCYGFLYDTSYADLEPIYSVAEGMRKAADRPNLQRSYEQSEAIYR